MHALLLASAVLDCGAVAGIGLLLKRSARERDTTLAAQRAALAHLREDVAQLVRDAEERTRGLAAALDARERRLRALIAETAASRPAPAPNPERPAGESTSWAGMDPAEARLRRDLEQTLPGLALAGRRQPGRAGDPLGLVPRLGDDGLKVPNGRADKPVGSRQAAVRGSSDESQ